MVEISKPSLMIDCDRHSQKFYVSSLWGAPPNDNEIGSEGQAYALLITGSVLASWDTHAGQVAGASRAEALASFEGYYNAWKEMCKLKSDTRLVSSTLGSMYICQNDEHLCKSGSDLYYCLPGTVYFVTGNTVTVEGHAMTSTSEADADAIVKGHAHDLLEWLDAHPAAPLHQMKRRQFR